MINRLIKLISAALGYNRHIVISFVQFTEDARRQHVLLMNKQ